MGSLKRVKVLLVELVNLPEIGERGFELTYFNPRGFKGTTLTLNSLFEESSEGIENTSVVTVASHDLNTSNSLNSSQMS